MEKLKLAAGMTGEQKRYAVEAALLLGFQTETATFPVITADGDIPGAGEYGRAESPVEKEYRGDTGRVRISIKAYRSDL